jgi:hypothetical protein
MLNLGNKILSRQEVSVDGVRVVLLAKGISKDSACTVTGAT